MPYRELCIFRILDTTRPSDSSATTLQTSSVAQDATVALCHGVCTGLLGARILSLAGLYLASCTDLLKDFRFFLLLVLFLSCFCLGIVHRNAFSYAGDYRTNSPSTNT